MARTRSAAQKCEEDSKKRSSKRKEKITQKSVKSPKDIVKIRSHTQQSEGRVTRSRSHKKNEQLLNGKENDQNSQNKVTKQNRNVDDRVPPQSPKNEKCQKIAKSKMMSKVEVKSQPVFSMDDIVLVQWRFFPHWPAQIIDICSKKATVRFFGSTENARYAEVGLKRLMPFSSMEQYMLVKLNSLRNPKYAAAIREAEITVGIPEELSILRRKEAIN